MVQSDVHFLQEDAVSWYAVTLLNVNDVANDEVSHSDRLASTEGTSVDSDGLVVDLILELEVLSLLDPIATGGNEGGKEKTTVNGQRLDVSCGAAAEHGEK